MIGKRSSIRTAMNSRGITREVERHVALVAVAEVGGRVLRPLVRLGEQHPVREPLVDVGAQLAQERVRLGQVLAVRALALVQVRAPRRGAARRRRGSSQKSTTLSMRLRTSGLSKLRSGWWE